MVVLTVPGGAQAGPHRGAMGEAGKVRGNILRAGGEVMTEPCTHSSIDAGCVWCQLRLAEAILDILHNKSGERIAEVLAERAKLERKEARR